MHSHFAPLDSLLRPARLEQLAHHATGRGFAVATGNCPVAVGNSAVAVGDSAVATGRGSSVATGRDSGTSGTRTNLHGQQKQQWSHFEKQQP